jgi:hypothetical protein
LEKHRGKIPVKLYIVLPNKTETIINLTSTTCDPSEEFLEEAREMFGYQPVTCV